MPRGEAGWKWEKMSTKPARMITWLEIRSHSSNPGFWLTNCLRIRHLNPPEFDFFQLWAEKALPQLDEVSKYVTPIAKFVMVNTYQVNLLSLWRQSFLGICFGAHLGHLALRTVCRPLGWRLALTHIWLFLVQWLAYLQYSDIGTELILHALSQIWRGKIPFSDDGWGGER